VTSQLISHDGAVCFGATYAGLQILHNDAEQFKAKTP
jgi:hypothetical protein